MKIKDSICLALVLCGGVWGICANAAPTNSSNLSLQIAAQSRNVGSPSWQATLRAEATNDDIFFEVPYMDAFRMFYTVPAPVGKIFESEPPAEIQSFLKTLRPQLPHWSAGIVDEWMLIVRDGLRGTPGNITNTVVAADGRRSTELIPTYVYSESLIRKTVSNGKQGTK